MKKARRASEHEALLRLSESHLSGVGGSKHSDVRSKTSDMRGGFRRILKEFLHCPNKRS
jgi:hypothetical protein